MKQDKEDVLNIFSVASGHLYERFLRLVQNLLSGGLKMVMCPAFHKEKRLEFARIY